MKLLTAYGMIEEIKIEMEKVHIHNAIVCIYYEMLKRLMNKQQSA